MPSAVVCAQDRDASYDMLGFSRSALVASQCLYIYHIWVVLGGSSSSCLYYGVTAEVGGPSTHWVVCNLRPFDIEVGVSMLVWTVWVHRTKGMKVWAKGMSAKTSVA